MNSSSSGSLSCTGPGSDGGPGGGPPSQGGTAAGAAAAAANGQTAAGSATAIMATATSTASVAALGPHDAASGHFQQVHSDKNLWEYSHCFPGTRSETAPDDVLSLSYT